MKEKFTQGEWKILGEKVGVVDKSDTQSYGMLNQICFIDKFDFPNEWTYNAHLIASAPDMYRMLDDIRILAGWGYTCSEVAEELELKIEEIEKLLAKARGE